MYKEVAAARFATSHLEQGFGNPSLFRLIHIYHVRQCVDGCMGTQRAKALTGPFVGAKVVKAIWVVALEHFESHKSEGS